MQTWTQSHSVRVGVRVRVHVHIWIYHEYAHLFHLLWTLSLVIYNK